ncbi:MAG: dUTP diphosphatase [Acidimicrobiales bacterium]
MPVPVVRLDPEVTLPGYARPGDAGADLAAGADVLLAPGGGRALVGTGLAVAIPTGYAGFVLPRSGLALHHGVTCLNAPGLIDSGYRGELSVLLVNTDPHQPYQVRRGDRIGQLVIQAVEQVEFVPVEELTDELTDEPTDEPIHDKDRDTRGTDGFGSTGVR